MVSRSRAPGVISVRCYHISATSDLRGEQLAKTRTKPKKARGVCARAIAFLFPLRAPLTKSALPLLARS
eukprot:5508164-Pyramimonas_sp.AAC.1